MRTTTIKSSLPVQLQKDLFNFGNILRPKNNQVIQYGAIQDPESKRAVEHAERFYEEVRHRRTDCHTIADNTGFRLQDIQQIKDHVFVNKHNLFKGYERFDPSFEMAQSWQRLSEKGGKRITNNDITLLNHEFLESILEKEGLDIDNAHTIAAKLYRYIP